ncbi:hypothetical protein Anas_05459 [Armadillidium nasatum]|uniref:Myb/SANT-like DNA-binding domain-containing protein n=1 Tax=Armadillidium nasatum TaxID=96803 RepID=A0A5N5T9F6_9CRUS|nr:hypothetical protein Anas_05459 [Armadillidium nasatum]
MNNITDQSYAQKVFDKCITAGLGSPKFADASTSAFPGWTNEMTLLLLDSLSNNYKLYKTIPLREQAYRNIVEDFSNKGFNISREEIKRKWGNLLGTYRRIRDRPKKPGGCKSLWPYYYDSDSMKFS